MDILATGGAGYVGSHTAKALARSGYQPIVLDNLRYGHREAVKWGPLIVGDLADRDMLRQVFQSYPIKAVIHFAAFAYVGESMRAPSEYFRNNVVNTLNLLDTMREHEVDKIVFSSSCATYGYPQTIPLREDHPQAPISPYGESKLMVERLLKWYGSAYGLSWTALRYFNAAGADSEGEIGENHDPETHLIPNAIAASLGHKPALNIFGTDYDTPDGTAVRDYVHVADLAAAHVQAVTRMFEQRTGEALNLGTGLGHSVREVVAMIEKVGDRKVPAKETPRREGDPPTLIADAANAARVLGWRPRYSSLQTIVETAWRWYVRPLPAALDECGNAGRGH